MVEISQTLSGQSAIIDLIKKTIAQTLSAKLPLKDQENLILQTLSAQCNESKSVSH
jgi:hypothetical protein